MPATRRSASSRRRRCGASGRSSSGRRRRERVALGPTRRGRIAAELHRELAAASCAAARRGCRSREETSMAPDTKTRLTDLLKRKAKEDPTTKADFLKWQDAVRALMKQMSEWLDD